MAWDTKTFISVSLLQHLLYCGGLQWSLQYFQGIPVPQALFYSILGCLNRNTVD